MKNEQGEQGVILALINRFESHRLPRALEIHARVKTGEILSDHDVQFLDRVMHDSRKIMAVVAKHPEYEDIASKAISLYSEIIRLSLENEKRAMQKKN